MAKNKNILISPYKFVSPMLNMPDNFMPVQNLVSDGETFRRVYRGGSGNQYEGLSHLDKEVIQDAIRKWVNEDLD